MAHGEHTRGRNLVLCFRVMLSLSILPSFAAALGLFFRTSQWK